MNDVPSGAASPRAAVVEAGLFNSESLFVKFDFTKDAMLAAGERYLEACRTGTLTEMPSEIKTYVHELTHYLHYTTTPYGLFLQYCRLMQSRATMAIVRTLLDAGIPFRMPLLQNVPALTGEPAAIVNRYLSLWLNVEHLAATLHGETERRAELLGAFVTDTERVAAGQRPLLPPLLDLRTTFILVQESLASLIEGINAEARAAGNEQPMELAGFDAEALRAEAATFPTGAEFADLRTEMAMDLVGNPFNVEAIIESAATAAEFWGSDSSYDQFTVWANTPVDPQLQVYRTCITQGLDAIKTRQLPEFILTYMALCELALYAPLLPQHSALRQKHSSIRQILPVHRWMELVRAAGDVAPMRDRGDYARFATDICRKLDWVHPLQVITAAVNGPGPVTSPTPQVYLWAQQWRARSLGTFLGVQRFLFDPAPEPTAWREMFNFVVLDYTDRTNYHTDKSFLKAMTTRHLNMLGMRCIMLGKNLTISAPYRGNPQEKLWMTEWLRERFKSVFGRDFPSLRFV